MTAFTGATPNFPALVLVPLNDTFQPKNILLHQRAKIGRQSNAKTIPTERNGYFDTKVISRQHAEVWVEDGKIWIKDVKSSNGTYVNTHRLALEGVESDPYELHTGDVLELGTDIASEDNTKIVHHKVAARVTCILTAEDAANHAASRQQALDQQQAQFTFGQGAPPRRPMNQINQMNMNGMGSLGASTRAPGTRSGLSFDHIMSKIQAELQKSRDTGAELHGLASAMNEIQDTLGGSLPIVPSQHPRTISLTGPIQPPAPAPPSAELAVMQSQISDTQSWIASQADRFKSLDNIEGVTSELSALRRDVDVLRDLVQSHRAANDAVTRSDGAVSPIARELAREEADARANDDDDDVRSIATLMPEEDRSTFETEPMWSAPEPETEEKEFAFVAPSDSEVPLPISPTKSPRSRLQPKREREEESSRQLEAVITLARELERQHAEATETIRALQAKVLELEARDSTTGAVNALEDRMRVLEGRQDAHEERTGAVQSALEGVRIEWSNVREDWAGERARIAKAVEEFEAAKDREVHRVTEARAPPSPPKSLATDSDEASGDVGEEGTSRTLTSGKRKKNRRRKSPLRRGVAAAHTEHSNEKPVHETDEERGEWEHKALLTPSSLSSSSSHARRHKPSQLANGSAAHDSGRSSIDSLPDIDEQADGSGVARVQSRTTAAALQVNLTPIAGTVAVCIVALAIAYGRDLRLVT